MNPEIFRAYDIRGLYGKDFTPDDFYTIAQAYARVEKPHTVVVGHDVRSSSPELSQQVVDGLMDAGVDVLSVGEISTDMLYFAVVTFTADGGIMITASHNPAPYNGMKLVREGAIPISGDSGITEIRDEALKLTQAGRQRAKKRGGVRHLDVMADYLRHIRTFVQMQKLKQTKQVVLNANGGLAGHVAEQLLADTSIQIVKRLFCQPDGTFKDIPQGRPDPLRPENRTLTRDAVKKTGADFATAWDADADRCFFFDEKGEFVEASYLTAVLAELLLKRQHGGVILFDPRVRWPIEQAVTDSGGTPVINKCGHSFMKERMRKADALFAGEASGHYYFRRNFYTDNGVIPFLLVLEYLCEAGISLSTWVRELRERFPVSGEINFFFQKMEHMPSAIDAVRDELGTWGEFVVEAPIDGLSVRFVEGKKRRHFRFNLRRSNTEPCLRLNVEARQDEDLLRRQTEGIAKVVARAGGNRVTPFRWELTIGHSLRGATTLG
jgi:phosphomannomutase